MLGPVQTWFILALFGLIASVLNVCCRLRLCGRGDARIVMTSTALQARGFT
jgi:hypothetical protein